MSSDPSRRETSLDCLSRFAASARQSADFSKKPQRTAKLNQYKQLVVSAKQGTLADRTSLVGHVTSIVHAECYLQAHRYDFFGPFKSNDLQGVAR